METKDLRHELVALGLPTHDVAVYLALLAAGQSPVGPLIKETHLHRNVVYTALDHLLARKLVTESKVRGKKSYAIASPAVLADEFVQKARAAKEAAALIAARMQATPREITIHTGNDEFLALLTGIVGSLPKKGEVYVLGTGGEDFMRYTMRPIWKEYHKVAEERGVSIRMISYENQRVSLTPDVSPLSYYDVRYLPDDVENPSGLHIYPAAGIVLNIIYSDAHTPVTAIKIRNKALVEGYLNLFNTLWGRAKG